MIEAPSPASLTACEPPRPRAAPVTSATLPSTLPMARPLLLVRGGARGLGRLDVDPLEDDRHTAQRAAIGGGEADAGHVLGLVRRQEQRDPRVVLERRWAIQLQ